MAPTPPSTNGLTPSATYPHSTHPIHATLHALPTLPTAPSPLLHAPLPRFHRRHYITLDEEFENARNTSHQQTNTTNPSHQFANHTAHHQFPQALGNVTITPDPQPTEENDPEESFGRAGMFRYGRAPYPRSRARRGEMDASDAQNERRAVGNCVATRNGMARQDQLISQEEEEGEKDEGFDAWCRAYGLLRGEMEENDRAV